MNRWETILAESIKVKAGWLETLDKKNKVIVIQGSDKGINKGCSQMDKVTKGSMQRPHLW